MTKSAESLASAADLLEDAARQGRSGSAAMKIVVAGYGSRGDVEPCAAVGRELLRRGHEVRMAVAAQHAWLRRVGGAYRGPLRARLAAQLNRPTISSAMIQNPISTIPRSCRAGRRVKAEKTTTLKSLADGADLLVAGFNERGWPPISLSTTAFRWLRCTTSRRGLGVSGAAWE